MANPFTGAAYGDAMSRVMSALVQGKQWGLSMDQMMAEIARQDRQFGAEQATRQGNLDIARQEEQRLSKTAATETARKATEEAERANAYKFFESIGQPTGSPVSVQQLLPLGATQAPQEPNPLTLGFPRRLDQSARPSVTDNRITVPGPVFEPTPGQIAANFLRVNKGVPVSLSDILAGLPVEEKWGANIANTGAQARLRGEQAASEAAVRPGKVATGLANAGLARARTDFLHEQTKWLAPKMKSQIDRDAARAAYDMKRTQAVDEQLALSRYRAQAYAANVNSLVEYRKKGGVISADDIIKLKLAALSNMRIADAQIAALVGRGDATDEDIAQLETDANEIRDLYVEVQGLESGTKEPKPKTLLPPFPGSKPNPAASKEKPEKEIKLSLTAGKSWGTKFSKLPPKLRTWAQKKRGEKKSDAWIADQLKAAGVTW